MWANKKQIDLAVGLPMEFLIGSLHAKMRVAFPNRNWWAGFVAGALALYLLITLLEKPESPVVRLMDKFVAIAAVGYCLYFYWTRRA